MGVFSLLGGIWEIVFSRIYLVDGRLAGAPQWVQVSVMQGAALGRSRPVVAISKTDLIEDARLGVERRLSVIT
jgi:hypothetical protein